MGETPNGLQLRPQMRQRGSKGCGKKEANIYKADCERGDVFTTTRGQRIELKRGPKGGGTERRLRRNNDAGRKEKKKKKR